MSAELKMQELGIELPAVATPVASYVNAVKTGTLLYLSGGLPDLQKEEFRGEVPGVVSAETAHEAARSALLGRLAVIRHELGSLDQVRQIVSLQGFVNVESNFNDVPQIINGASDLLGEIFGPQIGSHSRMAVGVASLPLGVCVEIAMVVEF